MRNATPIVLLLALLIVTPGFSETEDVASETLRLRGDAGPIAHTTNEEGDWVFDLLRFDNGNSVILKRQYFEAPWIFTSDMVEGKPELVVAAPAGKALCCTCNGQGVGTDAGCAIGEGQSCTECTSCDAAVALEPQERTAETALAGRTKSHIQQRTAEIVVSSAGCGWARSEGDSRVSTGGVGLEKGGSCGVCVLSEQDVNEDCSWNVNKPYFVEDYSGNSDACCENQFKPHGNCTVHLPCSTDDGDWCPTTGEWNVRADAGLDQCLEHASDCPDEWECGPGCSATFCWYIDTGESKCTEGLGCGLECSGSDTVQRKVCLCGGGSTCELVDQHLVCR